jgi:hypothetical protein
MVEFRKWFLALAIVGLVLAIGSSPANAQNNVPFTCQASAGVPNILRAEGTTELLGDLVMNCTGGTPTPFGQPVPLNNIQISINTYVTSRIEDLAGDSEALLLIDTPFPATGQFPTPPTGPTPNGATNALAQLACQANNSTNCAITSNNNIGAVGSTGNYSGATDTGPGPYNNHFNVFQGFQNGQNAIAWDGVPIDAPGTAGTRVIRITNVRANAYSSGVSTTLIPTSINMIVAVSGSSFITVLQPSNGNIVGQIAQGLIVSNLSASYQQCNNVNGNLLLGSTGQTGAINVTAAEGFAAAFKPQDYVQFYNVRVAGATSYTPPGTPALQNVPGFNYNSESGLYTDAPGLAQNPSEPAGLADHGTQLQFTVSGVGTGVQLFVPQYVYMAGNYGSGVPNGVAVLVSQSSSSSGAIASSTSIPVVYGPAYAPAAPGPPVSVAISGGTATVTYEVYYADPSVPETVIVPFEVSYITTGPTNPSSTTTPATVSVNFAPLSAAGVTDVASGSLPIPRFGQPHAAVSFFSINLCSCNLLFPFVTNIAGFDTGIAIANTTADTLNGLAPQSGPVTITYYGFTAGGGPAPDTQPTTSPVPAGSELIFTLSSGGNYGILPTPGFEGYLIVRADFQYCHGFAAITDQGAQRLGEGYLALQLDVPEIYRTGQFGENLGH